MLCSCSPLSRLVSLFHSPTSSSLATAKTAASASSTLKGAATTTVTATARASNGGGLSEGAKAGIHVGVVVGAIVGIGALWFFVMRAMRRSWGPAADGLGLPKVMSEQRHTVGGGWVEPPPRQEMDGAARRNELQGTPQAELGDGASSARYG